MNTWMLIPLLLSLSLQSYAASSCKMVYSKGGSTPEMTSVLDAEKVFNKLSKNGIVFETFTDLHRGFPFKQFPVGTQFILQEVTHAGYGWNRIHQGTLKSVNSDFLVLDVNGKETRIELTFIAGLTLFLP